MNDDFLNRFQKSPRAEFESALYEKLSNPAIVSNKKTTLRRLELAIGVLVAILALTVIFVPNARAAVQSVIRKIAGIPFDEVTQSPITCDPMVDCEFQKVIGVMSLEEAQAAVPFAVNLPTWVPEGYWQNPKVKLYRLAEGFDSVEIEWLKTGFTQENHFDYTQQMTLSIWQDQGDYPAEVVGEGSVSEIKIHGQPAVLIHRGWELFNKNWNGNGMTRITWEKNGVRYLLSAVFIEPATVITDEDMLRIAESVP